jgi:uncharacterized protein YndB with AHSA1/START domain
MTKIIKHHFFFPQPKETVWEYLTKAELLEQWLMPNDFEPVVGRDFYFKTKAIPAMNFDGMCHCKVLDVIPFEKLSYSWKGGPGNGDILLDTIVVWNLTSTDEGTNLFLEHSGFGKEEHANFFPGMTDGWVKNVQKILNRLTPAQHDSTQA